MDFIEMGIDSRDQGPFLESPGNLLGPKNVNRKINFYYENIGQVPCMQSVKNIKKYLQYQAQ